MAGGLVKYRHLSRSSSHRQALLRNLVTSLVKYETVFTTWHKAKEAQRLAEKLITLAKRDNEETRRRAQAILYTPNLLMPKLFGELKTRYADRPGGYTRVLRTEPKKDDQAPSAVLEFIDGPQDLRFAVTAAAVARDRELGREHSDLTRRNWTKVTRFRKDGSEAFEAMVESTRSLRLADPGTQLADVNANIFSRDPKWSARDIKPVHSYWNAGGHGGSKNSRSTSVSHSAELSNKIADALGDPDMGPSGTAQATKR